MSALSTLQARLELRRVRPGQWQVVSENRLGVVQLDCATWIIVRDGEAIPVMGRKEFTTLTEAHGVLADARDAILERRAA